MPITIPRPISRTVTVSHSPKKPTMRFRVVIEGEIGEDLGDTKDSLIDCVSASIQIDALRDVTVFSKNITLSKSRKRGRQASSD